jgi:hypothetical protein
MATVNLKNLLVTVKSKEMQKVYGKQVRNIWGLNLTFDYRING